MSCPYTNIFGKPGEGVHSYRIFDIAVIDVALTIVVGIMIANSFKWSIWIVLGTLFFLGIVLHRMFCVRTTVDKWLFSK
jgi:fatty acid desaturase